MADDVLHFTADNHLAHANGVLVLGVVVDGVDSTADVRRCVVRPGAYASHRTSLKDNVENTIQHINLQRPRTRFLRAVSDNRDGTFYGSLYS